MTYAISDLHGCYDLYLELLERIGLRPEDTLYILGDVIDRGPEGVEILLDMMKRPNVVGLMGNHEAMAVDALYLLLTAMDKKDGKRLTKYETAVVQLWMENGGGPTLEGFLELTEGQARTVLRYLLGLPLYREAEAGGRRFVLVHGGLKGFSPDRPLEDYTAEEILWCRPKENTVYYPDRYVVFGHTPVQLLRPDRLAAIYRKGRLIDIDCGCSFPGGRLGCLCLDTMEEIYI